jgi:glycosidase
MFEHDVLSVRPGRSIRISTLVNVSSQCKQMQLRRGGDLQGVVDRLDYIQGMAIGAIYIVGTPFLNMTLGADGY